MENEQVKANVDFLEKKYDKNESNICSKEIMDPKIIRSKIVVPGKITTLNYTKTRKPKCRILFKQKIKR